MQNVAIHRCGESQYYSILLYDTFPPITCVLSTRSKTHLVAFPLTLLHLILKNKIFSYNILICGGQLVISLNCSQSKCISMNFPSTLSKDCSFMMMIIRISIQSLWLFTALHLDQTNSHQPFRKYK